MRIRNLLELVTEGCGDMVFNIDRTLLDLRLKYLNRLLDTLTTVFDTHEVYFYLILNYNKPAALLKEIWFVLALLHAPGASVLID